MRRDEKRAEKLKSLRLASSPSDTPAEGTVLDPSALEGRHREVVNVTTALHVAWDLLTAPDFDAHRTPAMALQLLALMDRSLARLDALLEEWDREGVPAGILDFPSYRTQDRRRA